MKQTRRSRTTLIDGIVKAAADEFKRYGFAGAATAEIARKANVTEAQLFRYFGSKANLFRETIFKPLDLHFLNFVRQQNTSGRKISGVREQNRRYTTELQQFITDHSEMLTSLIVTQKYDGGSGNNTGRINSLDAFFEHCATTMAERATDKLKVDPKLLVRVTFAAVLGCITFKDWIFPAGLASDEEIRAAVNAFVMEGISVNYGRNV